MCYFLRKILSLLEPKEIKEFLSIEFMPQKYILASNHIKEKDDSNTKRCMEDSIDSTKRNKGKVAHNTIKILRKAFFIKYATSKLRIRFISIMPTTRFIRVVEV